MKIFLKILLPIYLSLISPLVLAQKQLPQGLASKLYTEAMKGQNLLLHRQYQEGKRHFLNLAASYPDSALPSFGLMALYNALMMENLDHSHLENFFRAVRNHNYYVFHALKDKKKATAWDYFLCGAGQGLQALRLIDQGKTLKALSSSKKSKNCFDSALKKDPKFHDAKLGLGLYLYWRSVFTTRYHLPFFKDKRKEGLGLMQEAVEKGLLTPALARFALMLAYDQERQYAQGLKISQDILEDYPNNLIASLYKGRFLFKKRQLKQAEAHFANLLKDHPDRPLLEYHLGVTQRYLAKDEIAKKHFFNYLASNPLPARQAYTHYQIGRIFLKQKQKAQALKHFKKGHQAYPKWKPNQKMAKHLKSKG